MIQNFHDYHTITTIAGGHQTLTGGPVASQEVIKELGTNGGGFFNANSAHPFENPTAWTNWLEIFLLLCISFSLPRTFGGMVGDNRQGHAIVAVMALLAMSSVVADHRVPDRTPRHRSDRGAARRRRAPRPDSGCRTRRHSPTARR